MGSKLGKALLGGLVLFCAFVILFTILWRTNQQASTTNMQGETTESLMVNDAPQYEDYQFFNVTFYTKTCPENCDYCGKVQNGVCDEVANNERCDFDGGDCELAHCDISINDCMKNPLYQQGIISCDHDSQPCTVLSWENCSYIGNNYCNVNSKSNSEECGYDGGDCQPNICFDNCVVPSNVPCFWYKDSVCDTFLNKSDCCYDGGDCGIGHGENCDAKVLVEQCAISYDTCISNPAYALGLLSCEELNTCLTPSWTLCSTIGDGQCDLSLNTKECYFDGGDCQPMICIEAGLECTVASSVLCQYGLGDNYCDEELNREECNFDHGDCIENFTNECPANCQYGQLESYSCALIANGYCDTDLNVASCNYDGGDCDHCPKDCHYPENWLGCWEIGNGFCSSPLNTSSCNYDGGDCVVKDDFAMVVSMKDKY